MCGLFEMPSGSSSNLLTEEEYQERAKAYSDQYMAALQRSHARRVNHMKQLNSLQQPESVRTNQMSDKLISDS